MIIANIRQFGEYMPLAPGVFNVVVIDEASQVSVAQAFPAMLRAKKLVVLGDTKQFSSNTKSSNASIALNDKYKSDLNAFFRQKVAHDAGTLQRLSRFDVKCSILEFCQLCANYSIMLRKHFRSYQELISYSSQTFYGSQLQAIKIRGVPLDDVAPFVVAAGGCVQLATPRFSFVQHLALSCTPDACFSLALMAGTDGLLSISIDRRTVMLEFRRLAPQGWASSFARQTTSKVGLSDQITLDIYFDGYLVEVFLNRGVRVYSGCIFAESPVSMILECGNGVVSG